jgi:hypothetical protein
MPLIGIVAAVGGFILLAVLTWAIIYSRGRSNLSRAVSEVATKDLYEREEAERHEKP